MEVALGMAAGRTDLGGFLANDDVATVGALPYDVAFLGEDQTFLDVGQELAITRFVLTLNGTDQGKFLGYLVEAFLTCLAGHAVVHVRPLEVLAIGGVFQIVDGVTNRTTIQLLVPQLGVLLLIGSCLLEDAGNLHITVLLCTGSKIGVLVPGH